MIVRSIFKYIIIISCITLPAFSSEVGVIHHESQGLQHTKSSLSINQMNPIESHHKNTITLSNGIKYKIYPFHGWDLDHWKEGHTIKLEKSQDLLYKTKLINLETNDSISVKRKAVLR